MSFERFFNLVSYLLVACGVFSLWVTGGVGLLTGAVFMALAGVAWRLEGGKWQISERAGTVIVVAIVPLAVLAWRFGFIGSGGVALAGLLGQLIIALSIVKLFQKKSDRDWVFLYLMAFFEVLLAAGVTISPLYLLSLVAFVLVSVCAVLCFEMRRSAAAAESQMGKGSALTRRLPTSAIVIALLILCVAAPLFFVLPRVGGAGFFMSRSGIATRTGFSDSVRLGEIGRIQQDDQVVMRVRVDGADKSTGGLKWRGVALDLFDNKAWRSTKPFTDPPYVRLESGYFQVNFASGKGPLTAQTFYVEPLDTPVLFALGRPVAVAGGFDLLFKNNDDNLKFQRRAFERITYSVSSDTNLPDTSTLRADSMSDPIPIARFLQLPDGLDPRIARAAEDVVRNAGAENRYDKARSIERYLSESLGYTLEMKAGGDQPVADFLFNVKEGHCEYFASAMVLMLRTQGIAARMVNGFQQGEYNETADVFVVRQRDAHSWVEVYFPQEGVWVPFDPTPATAQNLGRQTGVLGAVDRYLEALEMMWIQYFVAYDNQEQESLFKTVRTGVVDYQSKASDLLSDYLGRAQNWWTSLWGSSESERRLSPAGIYGIISLASASLLFSLFWFWRTGGFGRFIAWIALRFGSRNSKSVVEFYERMVRVLAKRGLQRRPSETPLEFALSTGLPEALRVTELYHQVRFGRMRLCAEERDRIESWLKSLETEVPGA